jgi:uncharacterized protein YacL
MVLFLLRALFILLMAAVGWFYVKSPYQPFGDVTWMAMGIAVVIGTFLLCVDILSPRRKLLIFSGTFFGLVIGISIAYALSFVVQLLADQYLGRLDPHAANFLPSQASRDALLAYVDMMVGVACCYLSISFILQTKDDFRFIIPYVEFNKQTKGARPILIDTSVLIDGRITDIAKTGILESQVIVPQFVLAELQAIADSGDGLKRARGRRGLDALGELRNLKRVEVVLYDSSARSESGPGEATPGVDHQLVDLAKSINARVMTNDFNLNKVASLRGVDVININELANAVKPVVLPGERMRVRIQKPGDQAGQGVGFLEDGTMVVVEQGRGFMNDDVEFVVTNMRQTVAGRMIFGRAVQSPLGETPGEPSRGPSGGSPSVSRPRPPRRSDVAS